MPGGDAEVLIVGASPAGLLLAGDLAADGVRVLVLDHERAGPGPGHRAIVHARALEQLDARGAADPLVAAGWPTGQVQAGPIRVRLAGLPSRFPFALLIEPDLAGSLLAARAEALGARIAAVAGVGDLRAGHDGVGLRAAIRGGPAASVSAGYLVCDDGDVAVRASLGSDHPGRVLAVPARARAAGLDPAGLDPALQDAANLGWKLASLLRGRAEPRLLASYQQERSFAAGHAARVTRRLLLAERIRPEPLRRAAHAVAAATSAGPLGEVTARAVSGISLAYPGGPHRLAGHRAPDLVLAGQPPHRLYQALRRQRPVLLAGASALAGLGALLALWPGRVTVAEPASAAAALMLIRPDGYVAWASDTDAQARRYADLRQALACWCGPPAAPPLASLTAIDTR